MNRENNDNVHKKELSDKVGKTEFLNNTAGVSIKEGIAFETGIPFVSNGEINAEISSIVYSHNWGMEEYGTQIYEEAVWCIVSTKKNKVYI